MKNEGEASPDMESANALILDFPLQDLRNLVDQKRKKRKDPKGTQKLMKRICFTKGLSVRV